MSTRSTIAFIDTDTATLHLFNDLNDIDASVVHLEIVGADLVEAAPTYAHVTLRKELADKLVEAIKAAEGKDNE